MIEKRLDMPKYWIPFRVGVNDHFPDIRKMVPFGESTLMAIRIL
jgi:hypothetical protein